MIFIPFTGFNFFVCVYLYMYNVFGDEADAVNIMFRAVGSTSGRRNFCMGTQNGSKLEK